MRTSAGPTWTTDFLESSPAFEALRPAAQRLGLTHWPGIEQLNEALASARVATGSGHPARLVAPGNDAAGAYEARAYRRGEISHREHDWHDLFNALVWLSFPRAKAALNERHAAELAGEVPGRRGRARDALTLFDEEGLIVVSSDRDLLALIQGFHWKELFWSGRAEVNARMRFLIFGHGLYAKALAPFIGMTGRAMLMLADENVFQMPLAEQLAVLDTKLAALLRAPGLLGTPLDLSPVPILGVPGWLPANRDEAFYDNVDYFRPGRARARTAT